MLIDQVFLYLKVTDSFNLKQHDINGNMFGTPVDLEVHRPVGSDEMYALDFSRMFPPEYSESSDPSTLCKLLRPELVKRFRIPLNNDAMTRFSSEEENLAVNK